MGPYRPASGWSFVTVLLLVCISFTGVCGEPLSYNSRVGRRALRSEVPISTTGESIVATPKPGLADDDGGGAVAVEAAEGDATGAGSSTGSTAADMSSDTPSQPKDLTAEDASSSSSDEMLSTGIDINFVKRVAGTSNCVVVTWANDHYRDFATSWVANLKEIGLTNYMVGAMDDALYKYLNDEQIPTWLMGSKTIEKSKIEKDFGWGSKNFHKMGRDKIRLIRDFTKTGIDVLISDIDTAWLRDPVPFFKRYPNADMLVSTDQLKSEINISPEQEKYLQSISAGLESSDNKENNPQNNQEGLEFHFCHAAGNIGMMWFRGTDGSKELTKTWVEKIEKDDDLWDQNAFNDLVREGNSCAGKSDPLGSGLYRGNNDKITIGTLPAAQFANGHVFHVQRTHSSENLSPYAVHNTFQYGGTPGKRHRMREANVWRGEDVDRFFPVNQDTNEPYAGFLSYDPRIPHDVDLQLFKERSWPKTKDDTFPAIESITDPLVQAHAKLIEFQLQQLSVAVAIATKLNRIVIAAPILCGLDRVWFAHFGRFPGSQFALPFICPLDHVLAVERSTKMSELREFSFLSHPELPVEVRESVVVVEVEDSSDSNESVPFPSDVRRCTTGPGTGADSSGTEKCGWLGIASDVSIAKRTAEVSAEGGYAPDQVAAQIAQVRSSKVIHLTTVVPFMKHKKGHKGWTALYLNAKKVVPPDVWCCASKDGHKQYEVE